MKSSAVTRHSHTLGGIVYSALELDWPLTKVLRVSLARRTRMTISTGVTGTGLLSVAAIVW
jgi:hypothetical protein